MRRTLTLCRAGLAVAAALAVLTACGGGGDNKAASSSSSAKTSSSSAPSGGGDPRFCAEAAKLVQDVQSTLTSETGTADVGPALQQAAQQLRSVEPPAEIASDWNALADGLEQLAAAYQATDFNDPNSVAAFQQKTTQLTQQLDSAGTHVESYLTGKCGIDTSGTGAATPSS